MHESDLVGIKLECYDHEEWLNAREAALKSRMSHESTAFIVFSESCSRDAESQKDS